MMWFWLLGLYYLALVVGDTYLTKEALEKRGNYEKNILVRKLMERFPQTWLFIKTLLGALPVLIAIGIVYWLPGVALGLVGAAAGMGTFVYGYAIINNIKKL